MLYYLFCPFLPWKGNIFPRYSSPVRNLFLILTKIIVFFVRLRKTEKNYVILIIFKRMIQYLLQSRAFSSMPAFIQSNLRTVKKSDMVAQNSTQVVTPVAVPLYNTKTDKQKTGYQDEKRLRNLRFGHAFPLESVKGFLSNGVLPHSACTSVDFESCTKDKYRRRFTGSLTASQSVGIIQ